MRHVHNKNALILRAKIDKATGAQHEIVAARDGNKIVVLSYLLVAAGAVTAQWESGSTDLTGAMTLATGVPNALTNEEYGMFNTENGEALNLTLGGAVQVSGFVTYIYVAEVTGQ